jgi:DNA-directed RNA polymerase
MKRFGRFSGYRNPVMRLNFVIFSKIRNFNHEYVNEIAGSMIVDCFWVITGNKNYAFISEQCLTTPKDHHEIINAYKQYFQREYGANLDNVFFVTESRHDLPVGNDSTIETGSIRTMLRTRGKL